MKMRCWFDIFTDDNSMGTQLTQDKILMSRAYNLLCEIGHVLTVTIPK